MSVRRIACMLAALLQEVLHNRAAFALCYPASAGPLKVCHAEEQEQVFKPQRAVCPMLTRVLSKGFVSIVFPTLIDHARHETKGEGRVDAVAAAVAEAAHPAKGAMEGGNGFSEFNEFNEFSEFSEFNGFIL